MVELDRDSIWYAFIVSCFVVFLTIVSNYVRFSKKQSKYIENNPWVTDIAVFFAAFMTMELHDPTTHHLGLKIISSLMITLIYKLATYEDVTDVETAAN